MSKLDGLNPKFGARISAAISIMRGDPELARLGVKTIVIVEGKRELTTQMAYYCRGRMRTEDVRAMFAAARLWKLTDTEAQTPVTWTLKSKHLDGFAVDLAPSQDGKSIWWNAPAAVWQRMGAIGKSFGLTWGGDWKDKVDVPHFEASEV